MKNRSTRSTVLSAILAAGLAGCGDSQSDEHGHEHGPNGEHLDGDEGGDMHDGDSAALGEITVGDLRFEAAQGHGEAAPGKELHIELTPVEGGDDLTVRVWIGTDDRLASVVGKADRDAETGTYEAHATAPDPLPDGAAWWVEVTADGGEPAVGSIGLK